MYFNQSSAHPHGLRRSPLMVVCIAVLFFSGAGCESPTHFYRGLTLKDLASGVEVSRDNKGRLEVFTMTSRAGTGESFNGRRGSGLTYGTAEVEIPFYHVQGVNLNSVPFTGDGASEWTDIRLDRASTKHITTSDEFKREIVAERGDKPVLLFVHGFNVDHASAVTTAGQVAFDIGGGLVPMVYSWPSAGKLTHYLVDANSVEYAAEQFARALLDLLPLIENKKTRFNLLAHSTGVRVTIRALRILDAELARRTDLPKEKLFNHLIFTGADADAAEVISAVRDLSDTSTESGLLKRFANQVTMYVHVLDLPVTASKYFHDLGQDDPYPRAGLSGKDVLLLDGIDTIDVSLAEQSALMHSYYSSNPGMLCDLHLLLIHNFKPAQRRLYSAQIKSQDDKDRGTLWLIRP